MSASRLRRLSVGCLIVLIGLFSPRLALFFIALFRTC